MAAERRKSIFQQDAKESSSFSRRYLIYLLCDAGFY